MELKEVTSKIQTLLKLENINDLPRRLKSIIFSSDRDKIFDDYLSLLGGLETDYIQEIYQYYMADRGKDSNQQDYTPSSIAHAVAELATCPNNAIVYDCCAGTGALTIAKHKIDNSLKFVCQELDSNVIPLLLFNLSIRGIEGVVVNGDVLKDEVYKAYLLTFDGKYSNIKELESYTLGKYDAVISNPPYNIKWAPPVERSLLGQDDKRFYHYGIPPKNNANFAFVLHCLYHTKSKGSAVLVLPKNITNDHNNSEIMIRRNLCKENLVDSIVNLPEKMFVSTSISTCLLTLKRDRKKQTVQFIDSSKNFHEHVRKQRGESHNANRIYNKKLKVLSDGAVAKIIKAIDNCEDVLDFAKSVSLETIQDKGFSWNPLTYIDFSIKQKEHRPYVDIVNGLKDIAKEKGMVKLTINQTIAKEIGWEQIAELEDENEKNMKKINEFIMKGLGLDLIENKRFITMSKKAGEIKIENTDKERISSLFAIFMPMFKQHLYYLNQKENELLAELRDAVLPELMSGKLDVSNF